MAWENQQQGAEDGGKREEEEEEGKRDRVSDCYDLPVGMSYLRRQGWAARVPFLPTFMGFGGSGCKRGV